MTLCEDSSLQRTCWTPIASQHTADGMEHNIPSLPEQISYNPTYLQATPLTTTQLDALKGRRLLVMGSGSGSNFEALTHTLRPLGLVIAGLFCNRPRARIVQRAHQLNVPVQLPPPEARHDADRLHEAILAFLAQPFDLLILAGYMRILPPEIVEPLPQRILNIHPSLLPAYPGLHAIQRAWEAGERHTGVSVHFVDRGVDTGPLLAQGQVPRLPEDSVDSLTTRIHKLEHALYPWVITHLLAKRTRSTP